MDNPKKQIVCVAKLVAHNITYVEVRKKVSLWLKAQRNIADLSSLLRKFCLRFSTTQTTMSLLVDCERRMSSFIEALFSKRCGAKISWSFY